ncbi:hypothetical protein EfmAA242_23250 [Enterococcus faecium]|nr:hypothetical protein EfmAA242_23250 [Enterococcus faecium]
MKNQDNWRSQLLNEKITEAKREVDRLTHVCQTKPFDSADFFENEFQIEAIRHRKINDGNG